MQDKLKQYRSLCQEVDEIQTTLAKAKSKKAILQLNARLKVCLRLISETDNFVMSVSDSLTRRILQLKYLQGQHPISWQQVAQQIGGGNSISAVHMRAKRFVKLNNAKNK